MGKSLIVGPLRWSSSQQRADITSVCSTCRRCHICGVRPKPSLSLRASRSTHHHPLPPNTMTGSYLDGFGTRAVHTGSAPSQETGAVIPPISLSTTYAQAAVGVHKGFEYTRSGNPNREQLERLLADIEEGGGHALAFASGSATTATVIQSLGPNAHVLSVNDVYGGTFRYMTKVSNLETSFVDLEKESDEVIFAAIKSNTKVSD